LETHLLFIDYEKTFDNIQREILFNILKSRHIPDTLLKAIVDIYTQNKILIHLTTNYQNRQKLLREYAQAALFHLHCLIYRVSQEERAKLQEGVPYVKLYPYNPKHLYPKLNGYEDNGKRSFKL